MQESAAPRPARRRYILWISLALLILLLAASALYLLQSGRPGSPIKGREIEERRRDEPARAPRREPPVRPDDPRRDRPRIEPD